jgi:hypothetical protein
MVLLERPGDFPLPTLGTVSRGEEVIQGESERAVLLLNVAARASI